MITDGGKEQFSLAGAFHTHKVLGFRDDWLGEPDFLWSQIEMAVKKVKKGKTAGFDNIPAELLKNEGDDVIEALHTRPVTQCGKVVYEHITVDKTLIIPLPNTGSFCKCNSYKAISLISQPPQQGPADCY